MIQGAPQLSISNITTVSEQGSKGLSQGVQLIGDLNKSSGHHNIKIGFSYLHDSTANLIASAPQRGAFNFNGQYSGNAYADFLLGYPSSTQKPNPNINDSPYGNNALYVPELQKIAIFGSKYPPANAPQPVIPSFLSLPIVFASQVNLPSSLFDYLGQPDKNVAPRFGFALQMKPQTVLRGGFGLFYNLIPEYYIQANAFENIPYFGVQTFSQPAGAPTLTMYAPFGGTGAFASNPSVNAQAKTVVPYAEQYNLALEQQVGKTMSIRVGYVGQRNLKQNNSAGGSPSITPDINQPVPAAGPVQPRRPVQPFASIFLTQDPIFQSTSNALQIGVHKRFDAGFQINAEYEYIRVLGTENFMNPMNTGDSYGNIGGITPQTLNVSYSYVLPFGRNQRFLGSSGNIVERLVSGFEISGITQYQGGQPFSVGYNTSVQGSYNTRANRVPGVPLYPATRTRAQWFNTAAFSAPAPFTYGNSAYNLLYGPHYQEWDISLAKNTLIKEGVTLQLRADTFNTFNHPNFANPSATLSNPSSFGQITGTAGQPRTMALGAKLMF